MSLIADALKTAQREKQRRESGGARSSISPVLVPLRVVAEPGFSWRRALVMGISGMVIVAAVAITLQRMKQPALPPISAPLAGLLGQDSPIGESSDRGLAGDSKVRVRPSSSVSARIPTARTVPPPSPRPVTRVARSAPSTAPKTSTAAVLQGQPRSDLSAPGYTSIPPRESPSPSAGQLRIALDQPRQSDAAQLLAEAIAAHRAGDLALARALYERVLLIAPNDPDALNNLAVLFTGEREFDRALVLLRRAAAIAPRNAGIWSNIGAALYGQGAGSDVVAAYQHALAIDPQHQGAKIGLAQQFLAIGAVPQARQLLEDVVGANPTLPEAQYALGQALELQGDRAGAIRAFTAFMRLAPAGLAAHVERVRRHVDSLSARAP
jgi:Tfp pilus assembly protein PilF